MDPLARLRSFPRAPSPNGNASAVRGNLTLEQKQLNANILAYHVAAETKVFASDAIKGLKLVEVNVKRKRQELGGGAKGLDGLEGEMICEIEVKEGMLNVHGGMAGGCFVAIMDIVTFGALFALGTVLNVDPSGVSTVMDVRWHGAALPGMLLSIVGTSLSMRGRIFSSRAEMYDKNSGKLLASMTHSIAPLSNLPSPLDQKAKTKL